MNTLLNQVEPFFRWIIETSWQASLMALAVLAIQYFFRRRLNPRWSYSLWLLVLLRLLLPEIPTSTFSIFHVAPSSPIVWANPAPLPTTFAPLPNPVPFPVHSLRPGISDVLALLWLTGVLIGFVFTWGVNHNFHRHLRHRLPLQNRRLQKLLDRAVQQVGLKHSPLLYEHPRIGSPAIMGLFRPVLLLPPGSSDRFDDDEWHLIFLHELAHLKRGDLIVQWLIALMQILHWFNPVLWLVFRRIRTDREPATDALVLSHAGESQKERYGDTLLKLLEHFQQRHSLPGLVGILEDQDHFKKRFQLIAEYTRGAYGWSLLALALILVIGAVFLTKERLQEPKVEANVIELFDAVWKGDARRTKAILEQGVDPNARAFFETSHKATALYYCADFNYPDVAQVLLEHGADPNLPNGWNDVPILRSLWRGYIDTANVLKEGGAKGKPEIWAVSTGDVVTLKKMADEGMIKKGGTAGLMSFAVASGQIKSIQYLEKLSENPVSPRLLEMAARTGQTAVMDYILKQGATLEKEGWEALSSALHWNQHQATQWLVDQGFDITKIPANEEPPLLKAEDSKMVEILLKAGADPNLGLGRRIPLTAAPDVESVDFLLKAGAKIPARSPEVESPILAAISYRTNPEVIFKLIELGVPFDLHKDGPVLCSQIGFNPKLMPILKILLSKGLRPDAPIIDDNQFFYMQDSLLHQSVSSPDILTELLKSNPDLNVEYVARDKRTGQTYRSSLLDRALGSGQSKSVQLLVKNGIKVPEWAFVYAATGDWTNLQKRIREGFDLKAKNNNSIPLSALDIAASANQTEIIDTLLKENYVPRSAVFGGLTTYCVKKPMVDHLLSIAQNDEEREAAALYGLWNFNFYNINTEAKQDIQNYMSVIKKPLSSFLLGNAINSQVSLEILGLLISKGIDLNGETTFNGKKVSNKFLLQQDLDERGAPEVKTLIQPLLDNSKPNARKEVERIKATENLKTSKVKSLKVP